MPAMSEPVLLGLGANLGDRADFLRRALMLLERKIRVTAISSLYETPALLPEKSPKEWNIPFLNAVVSGTISVQPEELLREVKSIEQQLGRQDRGRWGPREIDIDILDIAGREYKSEILQLPHPQMLLRAFVMVPLAEIAPGWRYPVAGDYHGKTAAEIAQGFADKEIIMV